MRCLEGMYLHDQVGNVQVTSPVNAERSNPFSWSLIVPVDLIVFFDCPREEF